MLLHQIDNTLKYIRNITDFRPEVGIILGTGLGDLVNRMEVCCTIDYADIPDFPVSTVKGHKGRFVFGMLGTKRVVAMQGRLHYYEGWSPSQVVFPLRVMARMGIGMLIVSNVSGGLNSSFSTGDIMLITDHINLIPNPLIGHNEELIGPRFPSMINAYDKTLVEKADKAAERLGIELRHGCYVGTTGPSYETPAECRYFALIGGDAVGMSTTPEVIAARHMNIPVLGLSVITNMVFEEEKPDHNAVVEQGEKAGSYLCLLVEEVLKELK